MLSIFKKSLLIASGILVAGNSPVMAVIGQNEVVADGNDKNLHIVIRVPINEPEQQLDKQAIVPAVVEEIQPIQPEEINILLAPEQPVVPEALAPAVADPELLPLLQPVQGNEVIPMVADAEQPVIHEVPVVIIAAEEVPLVQEQQEVADFTPEELWEAYFTQDYSGIHQRAYDVVKLSAAPPLDFFAGIMWPLAIGNFQLIMNNYIANGLPIPDAKDKRAWACRGSVRKYNRELVARINANIAEQKQAFLASM